MSRVSEVGYIVRNIMNVLKDMIIVVEKDEDTINDEAMASVSAKKAKMLKDTNENISKMAKELEDSGRRTTIPEIKVQGRGIEENIPQKTRKAKTVEEKDKGDNELTL